MKKQVTEAEIENTMGVVLLDFLSQIGVDADDLDLDEKLSVVMNDVGVLQLFTPYLLLRLAASIHGLHEVSGDDPEDLH